MATIFANHVAGTTTDNPLTLAASTVNSAGLANLPAVAAPNIMYLVLDPEGVSGLPEIVTVTAHTASATSATVTRGAQSTVAREHASGTAWVAAVTAADLNQTLIAKSGLQKGDLLVATGTSATARQAVGSNGLPLVANSGQTNGVEYAALTAAGLASDAVTTVKILDANVTTAKIADVSVTAAKIADLNVTTGKLADLGVTTGKLADDAVTGAKLGVAQQTYTPTISGTGWALGNGTVAGRYWVFGDAAGDLVYFEADVTIGSSTSKGSASLAISLPVAAAATTSRRSDVEIIDDSPATLYLGTCTFASTIVTPLVYRSDQVYLAAVGLTSTVPFTWATNDYIKVSGWYERA